MKGINILRTKVVASATLAVCAGINFWFKAPRAIVLLYWFLVYGYWVFSCVTDYSKLNTIKKETEMK